MNNFYIHNQNGLYLLKSRLLDSFSFVQHAYSTRLGGISTEECYSLNLSWKRRDSAHNVQENHRRFANAVGFSPENFVFIQLTHSDKVTVVSDKNRNNGNWWNDIPVGFDAMITNSLNTALLVRTADCGTALMLDPVKKVIAAVHSGWRGTALGIVKNTLSRMVSEFNCDPKNIVVASGPSICSKCFVAHQPVYSQFDQEYINLLPDGRAEVDLKRKILDDMLGAGISYDNIDFCSMCTCEQSELFFSHRREHGRTGIMGATIQLI